MQLSNNKILITGGGTGIGLGLTQRFLEEGNTLIICGRRADVLDDIKVKHPTVITRVCDVTNEASRVDLYNWIAAEHSDLNVLINNAGIQEWMNIDDDQFYAKAYKEINTNVLAPIHLCNLFINLPKLNTIMNVTSGLAFVQLTKVPVYCATKAFLHSFTQSLRHELINKHIEVIEIIPPALNTDLGGVGLHDEHPPVSAFIASIFEQLKAGKQELTFGFSEMLAKATPEEVRATFNRMNA
ncbi:MAG: SDR family NAD(P)-dependent oxidoreductase [Bacteroidota bacterium]|nr:SDR family NAD(P)-dependent oxidoreductase [Bacteroidota bacterium]